MAKKGTQSASKKAAKTAYKNENRGSKNKERKLERHLKSHPNDAQAQSALKANSGISGAKKRSGKKHNATQRLQMKIDKWSKRSEKLMEFERPKSKKDIQKAKRDFDKDMKAIWMELLGFGK